MATVKLLLITLLIVITFAEIVDATITIVTYTNSSCAASPIVAYFRSTGPCNKRKRSELGSNCYFVDDINGPFYEILECEGPGVPITPLPEGCQYITYNTEENCNFTTSFNQIAVPSGDPVLAVISDPALGTARAINITISCNSGLFSLAACVPESGCFSADSMPDNVCTNITDTILNRPYNGIQTTCVPPPIAPIAPVAPVTSPTNAPIAVPVALPTTAPKAATTPVKKTSKGVSSLSVIGSGALLAVVASLWW